MSSFSNIKLYKLKQVLKLQRHRESQRRQEAQRKIKEKIN